MIYKIYSPGNGTSDFPAGWQWSKFITVHAVKVSTKTEDTDRFGRLRAEAETKPSVTEPRASPYQGAVSRFCDKGRPNAPRVQAPVLHAQHNAQINTCRAWTVTGKVVCPGR